MTASVAPFVFIALAFVALVASVYVVFNRQGAAGTPDNVPIRLGVILLGAIALMCVGGLFYLSTPPELSTTQPVESTTQQPSEGGSQSGETGQTPGEAALLAQDTPQGATGPVATTANEAVNNAATDAATLGLAGQIVALLGTIAGAAVAGIAGLLVGPGRTDQGSNTDPRPTPGAGQ